MDIVLSQQADSGAFVSEVGDISDHTCFVTASVALLLDPTRHRGALSRALDFIERCETVDQTGGFCFYPPRGATPRLVPELPPDADDTALAWLALLHGGRRDETAAAEAFANVLVPAVRAFVPGHAPPWVRPYAVGTWLTEMGRRNPIDLTVNANVVAWAYRIGLEKHPICKGACMTLLAAARCEYPPRVFARRLTPYYADISELWFAVERAVRLGASSLAHVLDWLEHALSPEALCEDKPLYCNAHGAPLWRSPTLQYARRAHHAIQ